ncbi:hypothetical protein, partial [Phascolarctobacterium succinatutens]|uniref:hypothetical protein n=1 Tax=Phascolarctobacterium succinatutens TaxID=626940 RepID=UPI00307894A5
VNIIIQIFSGVQKTGYISLFIILCLCFPCEGNKKAALLGGFFIVALPHPCNKLHTIKLEEKENLKNLYVTEQQIVRFA